MEQSPEHVQVAQAAPDHQSVRVVLHRSDATLSNAVREFKPPPILT